MRANYYLPTRGSPASVNWGNHMPLTGSFDANTNYLCVLISQTHSGGLAREVNWSVGAVPEWLGKKIEKLLGGCGAGLQ